MRTQFGMGVRATCGIACVPRSADLRRVPRVNGSIPHECSSLQWDVRSRGQGLGEVVGAFDRCEVPGAVEVPHARVDKELVNAIGPGSREQRVVFWPQHSRRHRDPIFGMWLLFGDRSGDGAGTGPVPTDRGGERARLGVYGNQVVESVVGQFVARP
jgi:hypothetical protein